MSVPNTAVIFRTRPFSERCDRTRQRGDHALLGVSTNNSYFTIQRLTELVHWAQKCFRAVDIICADLHIDTVLVAEGADAQSAGRRARRRVRDVRRRIERALDAALPDEPRPGFHLLSDFQQHPVYQRLRADIDQALREDREFADACDDMVRGHLLGRPGAKSGTGSGSAGGGPGEAAELGRVRAGLQYLGGELPFFVDTPSILKVPSSVSCYHKFTPILGPLVRRNSGLRAAANQAFLEVTPVGTPDDPSDTDRPGNGNTDPRACGRPAGPVPQSDPITGPGIHEDNRSKKRD
ncbi:tRNA-dependent cyclodipeptide synthase [Streptomyces sp. NPDC003077]|uniref:tRNA-dependent cyclodipeptide synthase n=1 Tax=Streptomyces sp. NPDC003077 TaxID=3154443 RepID=UPI0033A78138